MFSRRLSILGKHLSSGVVSLGLHFLSGDALPSSAESKVHIHSRLLFRFPCGVVDANSASSTFRVPCDDNTLPLFWLELLASESDESASSTTGVGISSTSLLWKTTRLLRGNIRFDNFVDVAERSRLGKGLLRRTLRRAIEWVYGHDREDGDVSLEAEDVVDWGANGENISADCGNIGRSSVCRLAEGDTALWGLKALL